MSFLKFSSLFLISLLFISCSSKKTDTITCQSQDTKKIPCEVKNILTEVDSLCQGKFKANSCK